MQLICEKGGDDYDRPLKNQKGARRKTELFLRKRRERKAA